MLTISKLAIYKKGRQGNKILFFIFTWLTAENDIKKGDVATTLESKKKENRHPPLH